MQKKNKKKNWRKASNSPMKIIKTKQWYPWKP